MAEGSPGGAATPEAAEDPAEVDDDGEEVRGSSGRPAKRKRRSAVEVAASNLSEHEEKITKAVENIEKLEKELGEPAPGTQRATRLEQAKTRLESLKVTLPTLQKSLKDKKSAADAAHQDRARPEGPA